MDKPLLGIFFVFFINYTTGYEILFQQAKLTLTIPLSDSQRQVVDKNPIIKLKVLDVIPPPAGENSTLTFWLEEHYDFLQIDRIKGELWFKQDAWDRNQRETRDIVITAEKSNGASARMTLDLIIQPVTDVNVFCEKFLCFYGSVTFHAIEDYLESFKSRDVAEISPKIYGRFCKMFEVQYELLNATEFLSIKGTRLVTAKPLNHELMSPGPELKAAVQCSLKFGQATQVSQKVFNITVIDRNDNSIKVQDSTTNLTLNSPYFQQDSYLQPSSFILFRDEDSSPVNMNIGFHLLNDKAGIFKEVCNKVQQEETRATVFQCNLKFTKSGHFTSSPYCVTLQAREVIKGKTTTENSTVCISTNLASVAHGVEFLPEPAKLRASDRSNKKIKKITSNPATSGDAKVSSSMNAVVEYPDAVEVLQSATNYARVTQPVMGVADGDMNFKILKDPFNIFGITKNGGIVYVRNSALLETSLPATHVIDIGWKGSTKSIKISIIESNTTLHRPLDPIKDFCSNFTFQEDCESAFGFGSKTGRCQWRPYTNTSLHKLSSMYATCTSDIATCSDGICDPLEKLARKQFPQVHICPQDCTTETVHGLITSGNPGIGKAPPEFVCRCDENEQCDCGIPHRPIIITTNPPPELTNDLNSSSSGEFVMNETMGVIRPQAHCGTGCMLITIGCPSFLVFTIICLITMRRRYVKKMKKRMLQGQSVHYRGSNDTEIIHINILNEGSKDNYETTYQKFDFDAKWEFDRSKLILDTTLGVGEFGKVMKAYASDLNGIDTITTVAVKTVKTSNNSVELLALLSEFQLLQEVSHPNVIKLLGACIKGEPPLIIIEYCCFGSLRSYLRLSRKLEESSDLAIDGVEPVTATDVLSFAWQICKGMAYLTEMKLVHRDLAARNVLLAEGKVCKISDFGLTRDVYEDDAYLKKSRDRVPVKWLSPESLADHVYTTKTDVWSFGIVGYELITLGATPYPGIPPQNLYHLLRSGYRMERPENCSTEIYTLLEACWADDPNKRPSFKYLASKFEKLLGRSAKYLEVEVEEAAISNPLYLANVDEISTTTEAKTECTDDEPNRHDELWSPPKFKSDASKVDNKKYLLKYDDQLQLLLAHYDQPKPLSEAKSTAGQKLRYQNDFHTFLPPNTYVNSSQPDLMSLSDRERLIESRYDTPRMRSARSYVEMRNIVRCRKTSNSTTNDSFDDNNNEMPCDRTTINENLDFNDLDKLLNTDKEISFRFSSLNNLNQKLTTETKC